MLKAYSFSILFILNSRSDVMWSVKLGDISTRHFYFVVLECLLLESSHHASKAKAAYGEAHKEELVMLSTALIQFLADNQH